MTIRRITSHSLLALAEGALIALLIVGLIAGTALAAPKGSAATGGSYSLNWAMVVDANGDRGPDHGDTVKFTFNTSVAKPWVALNCSQSGKWVYTASVGYFPAYPWPATFTLSSGSWTSGGADCTAKLYYVTSNGRNRTLTTMSFAVGS